MDHATAWDCSADCAEAAVSRLEDYQDEIARCLEPAGLPESRLEEMLIIVSQLALEMYSRGRSSCRIDFSQN